jgi:hypothetical protein
MATKKSTARAVPAPRMNASDKRYQAQDDLRTIQRANEIQGDKSRMSAAQKEATNQMAALSSVAKKK